MLSILRKKSKKGKDSASAIPSNSRPSSGNSSPSRGSPTPLVRRPVRGLTISAPILPESPNFDPLYLSPRVLSPFEDIRNDSSGGESVNATFEGISKNSAGCEQMDGDGCPSQDKADEALDGHSDPPKLSPRRRAEVRANTTSNEGTIPEASIPIQLSSSVQLASARSTKKSEERIGYGILHWKDIPSVGRDIQQLFVEVCISGEKRMFPMKYRPENETGLNEDVEETLTRNDSRHLVDITRRRPLSSEGVDITPRVQTSTDPIHTDLDLYAKELEFISSAPELSCDGPVRTIGIVPPFKQAIPVQPSNLSGEVNWQVTQKNIIRIDRRRTKRIWTAGSILGVGTFGTVYRALNIPTRTQSAVKVVKIKRPLSEVTCQGLVNELKVLQKLSRRGLNKVAPFVMLPSRKTDLWAWQSSDGFLFIALDFYPGGDLYRYMGKVGDIQLLCIAAELVLGLLYLHGKGIVHHDLKPENILIDRDGHIAIADFGGAKFMKNGTVSRKSNEPVVCTLPYAAPEVLSHCPDEVKTYTAAADFFALGLTLLALYLGHDIFTGDVDEVRQKHRNIGSILSQYLDPESCELDFINLSYGLVCFDPEERLGSEGHDIKAHDYFSSPKDFWEQCENRRLAPFKTVIHDGGLAQGYKAECKSCEFADDGPVARFENVLYKEGMQLRVDEGFDVLMEHRRLTL